MTKRINLPVVQLRAAFHTSSVKADARTAEVIWKTSRPVLRSSLFDGDFLLDLSLDAKHVRMERLQSGSAPLLAAHNSHSLDGVIGVVETASVDGKVGRARVRFSERPEADAIFQDVRSGILRNVSVGLQLHKLEEQKRGNGDELPVFRSEDWEPTEVSVVPVNGDAGAVVLSDARTHECLILKGGNMDRDDTDTTTDTDTPTAEELAAERKLQRQEQAELAREGQAHRIAKDFGTGEVAAQRWIRDGLSRYEMLEAATEARANRTRPTENNIGFGDDFDSPGERIERMALSLVARATRKEPTEPGRQFYGMTLAECAYELLRPTGHVRGLDVRHHAGRIIQLGHTTSDFPLLLQNVLNKFLRPSYENAQVTFRLIAAERQFNDFRPHHFLRAGDFPVPLQVAEHGEIQQGTMGENDETVTVLTYGRIFAISRQALINDDLGSFDLLAGMAAQRVADFHNTTFFNLCILPASGLGPNVSDSVAVYNSAHANVATAGVLDVAKIGAARALMMAQTSLDGLKLNVSPKFLLVSPASLTLAEQLTTAINPTQPSEANPFSTRIIAVGDANLTGTRFYVLADPARLPQYIYGFLDEQPLRFETRVGFEIEGIDAKVVTDFGVGAIEYRAGVTGAGV